MSAVQMTKMVVLDFSGTLSLEMALYARPENLIRALQQSSLWSLGVNTLETFWGEIVNPTWTEGSTTTKGYKRLMAERVALIAPAGDAQPAEDVVGASVSKFVDGYLGHSTIDPAWQPVLQRLQSQPDTVVVVATDHYAEATGAILGHLEALGLEAEPALQAKNSSGHVGVANSADIGYHKASRDFWQAVQRTLALEDVGRVIIIDDFGFNEQSFDKYADQPKIVKRMQRTVDVLAEVFEARTEAFPFFLHSRERAYISGSVDELRQDYRDLVKQAGQFIHKMEQLP